MEDAFTKYLEQAGWNCREISVEEVPLQFQRSLLFQANIHYGKKEGSELLWQKLLYPPFVLQQFNGTFVDRVSILLPVTTSGRILLLMKGAVTISGQTNASVVRDRTYGLLAPHSATLEIQFDKGLVDFFCLEIGPEWSHILHEVAIKSGAWWYMPLGKIDRVVGRLLEKVMRVKLPYPDRVFFVQGACMDLLVKICRTIRRIEMRDTSKESSGGEKNRYEKYIQERLEDPILLEDMARHFHQSLSGLKQEFKKLFQHSIHQYVIVQRLEKVKLLLTQTSISMYEISLQAGFSDASHLGKRFKRRFGITPMQYRSGHERTLK